MCGNILVDVGITRQQTCERLSTKIGHTHEKKKKHSITCGTEGDECERVFADHRQFVFGKGQPAYDVLYKIIGDDRGHVPLQLPQHHQLPVLKRDTRKDDQFKCSFLAQSGG